MNYEQAVDYIYSIPKFTKKGTLDQTRTLMALIGNPQDQFKYIHVAGTNGKGSVCALIDCALRNCDVRTGLFTSPHLVHINERIVVDGEQISDDDFTALFNELKAIIDEHVRQGGIHPTFFEWIYMMAMMWFARQGVEYAVVETGLGGRLDATNVIAHPELTIITSIGYDHMQYLGSTIPEIAAEKAGIIKPDTPLVYDDTVSEASKVITKIFDERHSQPAAEVQDEQMSSAVKPGHKKKVIKKKSQQNALYKDLCMGVGRSFLLGSQYAGRGVSFDAIIDGVSMRVFVPLLGTYQLMNSLIALNAMAVIGRRHDYLDYEKEDYYALVREGFEQVVWPGRMEQINPHLYIDGAHNVSGMKAFCESVFRRCMDEDVYLLFAVAEDKDYSEMIRLLCNIEEVKGIMVTCIESDRRVDVTKVADLFRQHTQVEVRTCEDTKTAFDEAVRWTQDGILCCCGSLYLAGSIKAILED